MIHIGADVQLGTAIALILAGAGFLITYYTTEKKYWLILHLGLFLTYLPVSMLIFM